MTVTKPAYKPQIKKDAVNKVHLWKPSQNHACERRALQGWCDTGRRLKWVSRLTEQVGALLPSRWSETGTHSELEWI